MKYNLINEETKKEIEALTIEETRADTNYSYGHELRAYGIEAVAHMHLMRSAMQQIKEGKGDLGLNPK